MDNSELKKQLLQELEEQVSRKNAAIRAQEEIIAAKGKSKASEAREARRTAAVEIKKIRRSMQWQEKMLAEYNK